MSGFDTDWLRLREPLDSAARAAALVAGLAHESRSEPRAIVDLGAGAGANLRYAAPLLRGMQRWTLVDDDAALLSAAQSMTRDWATARGATVATRGVRLEIADRDFDCRVDCRRLDLARNLPALELPPGVLVTASALLDLVSAQWLEALARRCAAAGASVLFALNYDGRTVCTPAEPEDAEVLAHFNRHQRGDKSFGPALGPDAATATERVFAHLDYRVTKSTSDWRIDASRTELQRALVDGWLAAALEIAPERSAALRAWHRRRVEYVERGESQIVVGHVDVAATPPV